MKTTSIVASVVALILGGTTQAFNSGSLPNTRTSQTVIYGYVPSGFTPEQYKKFKEAEAKKKVKQNLGGVGPRGFESRSFESFHQALESGEAKHLLPVFNFKERVKKGELKAEDVPYMQRGGSWDNSDVTGAKKARWLKSDKDYAASGFIKNQSASIFGLGPGLDWTGSRDRSNGAAPKFGKNYKAPNVKDLKKGGKIFGLF